MNLTKSWNIRWFTESPRIFTNCNYQKQNKRKHIEGKASRFISIVITEVLNDRDTFVKDPIVHLKMNNVLLEAKLSVERICTTFDIEWDWLGKLEDRLKRVT